MGTAHSPMFRKPPESPKPPAAMGLLRCLPISTTTDGPTCTLLVIRLQIFSTTTVTTVLLPKSAKRPVLHTAKRAPCRRGGGPPAPAPTPKVFRVLWRATFTTLWPQMFSSAATKHVHTRTAQ